MSRVPDQIIGYVILTARGQSFRRDEPTIYRDKIQADNARLRIGGLVCGLYAFPTSDDQDTIA